MFAFYNNMGNVNPARSLLIVPYEWKLENAEKDFKTVSSKLILFRGEKAFRVALKNSENGQATLIFLAINLNRIGLQVSEVFCGKDDADFVCLMNEKKQPPRKKDFEEGYFQFFSSKVDVASGGNFTFVFQIHLEGIVDDYTFKSCDRLAKEQLWSSVNSKLHTDAEFIVQDKRFSAHKAILAARSPVFQAEFSREESKKDNPHHIQIDDVNASSFEQFLHFVYTGEFLQFACTGEPAPMLANKDLLKLAERYQLKTLENLCRIALLEVNAEQMVSFVANLRSNDGSMQKTSCKNRSDIFPISSLNYVT